MAYNEAIFNALMKLWPLAAPAEPAEAAYWIVTQDGDTGDEYCSACTDKEVERLRAESPDIPTDEIYGDGGFSIEHDHGVFCAICGIRLNGSLTDYGTEEEINHFNENGFICFDADEAWELNEALSSFEFVFENSSQSRLRTADLAERVAAKFFSGKQYQEVTQPGIWADDGGRCD